MESARPEDSKTVPESWIWWRFGWVIWGFAQLILNKKFPVIESVPKLLWWSGFWNSTSQSTIHQLLDVWYVLGTLEQMIHPIHAEVGDFLAVHHSSFGTDLITGNFSFKMSCTKPQITQPFLHQMQLSGTVLESSGHVDSKTVIGFWIWPSFEGVIEVSLGDKWK